MRPCSEFNFSPMTEAEACLVVGWRYDPPYDVYDVAPADRDETVRSFLDPALGYHAARLAGELVGFCCFGVDARVPGGDYSREELLDVGLGLRPDLTGKGLGRDFVEAILAFAAATGGYRVTVAAFNQRAVRVYERAGFRTAHTFEHAGKPWVQLVRP